MYELIITVLFTTVSEIRSSMSKLRKCKEQEQKAAKRYKRDNATQVTLKRTLHTGTTFSESLSLKKIDQALLQMLAQYMQHASIVEDAWFQFLVLLLNSRYLLPSRRTLVTAS